MDVDGFMLNLLWFNHNSPFRFQIPVWQERFSILIPRCSTPQVDVFSFAMVIYEIVCREVPFEEEVRPNFWGGLALRCVSAHEKRISMAIDAFFLVRTLILLSS